MHPKIDPSSLSPGKEFLKILGGNEFNFSSAPGELLSGADRPCKELGTERLKEREDPASAVKSS